MAEIVLAEGTSSELALGLHAAIAENMQRWPERDDALRRLHGRAFFHADDTEQAVTIEFSDGEVRIEDGESGPAAIRILGDQQTILTLTKVPLAHGLPDLRSPTARLLLRRQLGGELTIRGLILHAPQVARLLRVLAGG